MKLPTGSPGEVYAGSWPKELPVEWRAHIPKEMFA